MILNNVRQVVKTEILLCLQEPHRVTKRIIINFHHAVWKVLIRCLILRRDHQKAVLPVKKQQPQIKNNNFFTIYWLIIEPQVSLCGNGVVEDGEECDCGWEEDCRDQCCFPQRRYPPIDEPPCHLTPHSICSPSQVIFPYCANSILLYKINGFRALVVHRIVKWNLVTNVAMTMVVGMKVFVMVEIHNVHHQLINRTKQFATRNLFVLWG